MPDTDPHQIRFDTVVIGVDGHRGGREAISLAAALLEPGGRLILANVVRPRSAARLGPLFAEVDRRAAAEVLDAERARLEIPALTEVIVRDSVADGLHAIAARVGADLLVVGSAHRGAVGRIVLGDDARGVLNGAHCAVAIAPLGVRVPVAWRTIAVGDDGSAESALALACARRVAARLGAAVRACSAVGPSSLTYHELSLTDSSDALAVRVVQERKRLARYSGVETEVLEGDPGEALTELSSEVDLIVIGSRGQGPWGRLMTGSTSEYLSRRASCPVLILPRGLNPSAAGVPDEPSQDLPGPAVAAS